MYLNFRGHFEGGLVWVIIDVIGGHNLYGWMERNFIMIQSGGFDLDCRINTNTGRSQSSWVYLILWSNSLYLFLLLFGLGDDNCDFFIGIGVISASLLDNSGAWFECLCSAI